MDKNKAKQPEKKVVKAGKTPRSKKQRKHPGGRPLFDGKNVKDVLAKLEEAYAIGATDIEACCFADISTTALSRYLEKNKKFRARRTLLKQRPILAARNEVVKGIKGDKEFAFRYLSRKRPGEFGLKKFVRNLNTDVPLSEEAEKILKGLM